MTCIPELFSAWPQFQAFLLVLEGVPVGLKNRSPIPKAPVAVRLQCANTRVQILTDGSLTGVAYADVSRPQLLHVPARPDERY